MRTVAAKRVVVTGAVLTVVAVAASLGLGVYRVTPAEVVSALRDLFTGGPGTSTAYTLVVHMRLPRAVGALCVGSALGTAGCMLQALLRNPLASPFVIGTAQASGFGAVLAIFLGLGTAAMLGFAFAMAVVAALLVLSLSRTQRSLPTESVVLTGLSMSLLFGSLIGLVRYLARDEGVLSRIALWILGGLWHLTWGPLAVMAPPLLLAVVARLRVLAPPRPPGARRGRRGPARRARRAARGPPSCSSPAS